MGEMVGFQLNGYIGVLIGGPRLFRVHHGSRAVKREIDFRLVSSSWFDDLVVEFFD
jgi:hypothetical protein